MKSFISKMIGASKDTQESAEDIYSEAELLAKEIERSIIADHNKLARLVGNDRRTERKRKRIAESIRKYSEILESVRGTSKSAAFMAGINKS